MGSEFFGEKIIFPSAPVPGINNDQSLISYECIYPVRLTIGYWQWRLQIFIING